MVGGSLRVLQLLPPLKAGRHDIVEILLKVGLKHKQKYFFYSVWPKVSHQNGWQKKKIKWWDPFPLFCNNLEISKAMNFICVLSRVNTVTFSDVTVDIDLSVYEKSSAETMAGKRKQMSTPQKEVAISLFEDGVNRECWISEILGVSQSGVSKFLKQFNQHVTCENEWRSGRPGKTDDHGDRKILSCCITCQGVGTFTEVDCNINSWKYINILDTYLWPVMLAISQLTRICSKMTMPPHMLLGRQNGGNRKTILNVWHGPLNHRTLT